MKQQISIKGTDGTRYTINTSHIVFYESISKPVFNGEYNTWEDLDSGSIIYLTNKFNPIKTSLSISKIDQLITNQKLCQC